MKPDPTAAPPTCSAPSETDEHNAKDWFTSSILDGYEEAHEDDDSFTDALSYLQGVAAGQDGGEDDEDYYFEDDDGVVVDDEEEDESVIIGQDGDF